ncbi:unnamed protein product [Parajaminaea phylloscopi]
MAFFDLNVPVTASLWAASTSGSRDGGSGALSKKQKAKQKKGDVRTEVDVKGKQKEEEPLTNPLDRISATERDELQARVKDLRDLGYSTIAFNHTVRNRLDPAVHRNPFYTPLSVSSDPSASSSTLPSSSSSPHLPAISTPAFPQLAFGSKSSTGIEQLNRITLVLDATADAAKGGGGGIHPFWPALVTYDLLAVQPLTANQFNAACLTYTELKPGGQSFDIISLDLSSSPRLPFHLKRSTIGKALDSGAVFEVCYGDATTSSPLRREDRVRNLISNTRDLLRVTSGGKGVILSSGASSILGLRSPLDVANLASLFGFHPQRAREALSQTSRQIVQRAHARRTFRGVVSLPQLVNVAPPVSQAIPPPPASIRNPQACQNPDPERDLADLVEPTAKKRKVPAVGEEEEPDTADVAKPDVAGAASSGEVPASATSDHQGIFGTKLSSVEGMAAGRTGASNGVRRTGSQSEKANKKQRRK